MLTNFLGRERRHPWGPDGQAWRRVSKRQLHPNSVTFLQFLDRYNLNRKGTVPVHLL